MSKDFRELSRNRWWGPDTVANATLGCLQRIADSNEVMAKNHTQLIYDRDYFERRFKEERDCGARLVRRLSAARGQITKLRKALAAAKGGQP